MRIYIFIIFTSFILTIRGQGGLRYKQNNQIEDLGIDPSLIASIDLSNFDDPWIESFQEFYGDLPQIEYEDENENLHPNNNIVNQIPLYNQQDIPPVEENLPEDDPNAEITEEWKQANENSVLGPDGLPPMETSVHDYDVSNADEEPEEGLETEENLEYEDEFGYNPDMINYNEEQQNEINDQIPNNMPENQQYYPPVQFQVPGAVHEDGDLYGRGTPGPRPIANFRPKPKDPK